MQKPGRYIGGEWNQIVKEGRVECRMALCYPDTYEVGMSHLGSRILYEVANRRKDTACERAFLPWPDRQEQLLRHGRPLTTLETKTPLRELDVIGITLQYELSYPGVVKLLDLGHIPARAAERDQHHPFVIGGGPCAAAPEPIAPFFDALVVGDGEEVLHEVIDVIVRAKRGRRLTSRADREAVLRELALIEGVYVPSLYQGDENRPYPIVEVAPETIRRRIVADLESAPFPLRPIVPFLEIVHDRAQLEVNRGCTHGCRFCQAGILYRPVRQRSLQTLQEQARAILASTGYEQLSLSSLSCTDYPHIVELIDGILEEFAGKCVSISLPSLRTDQFGIELAQRVSQGRRSPVTLAPEAGSERLRAVINKSVTDENLREAAAGAFRAGWHSIKLYYMIGLPTETDDDLLALANEVRDIVQLGRKELGNRAGRLRIPVTIAGFVPKPHTPFETEIQCCIGELYRKQALLRESIRERAVELKLSLPEQAALEGILARGGRRLAAVIELVARSGQGLESWQDWFAASRWAAGFAEIGSSIEAELGSAVGRVTESPWSHIDSGVTSEFREREREKAYAGRVTPDCRQGPCEACGLENCCSVATDPSFFRLPFSSGRLSLPPDKPVKTRPPVCQAIFTFAKGERARYLGHLDITRALQRALRRANLPLAYTEGFHQRPRMAIARPLPLGATGDNELCAVDLYAACSSLEFARALNRQLPDGLVLREVQVRGRVARSPFGSITRARYTVTIEGPSYQELSDAVAKVLSQTTLPVNRETKRGERRVDIRPGVIDAEVQDAPLALRVELACTDEYMVKPEELVEAINVALAAAGACSAETVHIHRDALVGDGRAP